MLGKALTWLSYHNGVVRELPPDCFDEFHKVLGISVGHIQANVLNEWNGFQNAAQFLQICLPTAWAHSHMLRRRENMLHIHSSWGNPEDRTFPTVLESLQITKMALLRFPLVMRSLAVTKDCSITLSLGKCFFMLPLGTLDDWMQMSSILPAYNACGWQWRAYAEEKKKEEKFRNKTLGSVGMWLNKNTLCRMSR